MQPNEQLNKSLTDIFVFFCKIKLKISVATNYTDFDWLGRMIRSVNGLKKDCNRVCLHDDFSSKECE